PALTSPAAGVEVKETLTGSEGGNVTLPASVGESGLLIFEITTLAVVHDRKLDIWQERYRDRIVWNRTTGLFTITALQRDDTGIYTVESNKGNVFVKSYSLTVFAPVAGPAGKPVNESCFLLCSVDKAADVKLRWSRDEQMQNQISSTESLLLTVTQQNLSSSYRCEAGNPAENKSLQMDAETFCSGLNLTGELEPICCPEDEEGRKPEEPQSYNSEVWWFLLPLLVFKTAAVVVFVVVILTKIIQNSCTRA
ncbi:T-lymphocyte surface antigen Ly-9-like, partial [Acanthochromis polyacanthus]|uniref:T-lymphocyte surface antigen Ly-9-like n=1 Tax=Acanthochromis polyacanthus TaxID=80966 RepID=UPI002234DF38